MNLKLVSGLVLCGAFAVACGDSGSNTAGGPAGGNNNNGGDNQGGSTGVLSGGNPNVGGMEPEGGQPPGDGICGSDLTIDGDTYDGCLSANCCGSFDPCAADSACADCLADPTGAGCDTNALYTAFQGCFDTSCPTAICDSKLATPSPNLNACVQDNCCASFTPCEADIDCNACLMDPMVAGCDANALFGAYETCRDTNCPQDICGTQIIFGITYDNGAQDTAFDSNLCAQDNCCTDLTECADPTGDGFLEMDDPGVAACLLCLQGDPSCGAGAVSDAADAFNACFTANCN